VYTWTDRARIATRWRRPGKINRRNLVRNRGIDGSAISSATRRCTHGGLSRALYAVVVFKHAASAAPRLDSRPQTPCGIIACCIPIDRSVSAALDFLLRGKERARDGASRKRRGGAGEGEGGEPLLVADETKRSGAGSRAKTKRDRNRTPSKKVMVGEKRRGGGGSSVARVHYRFAIRAWPAALRMTLFKSQRAKSPLSPARLPSARFSRSSTSSCLASRRRAAVLS